MSTGHSPVRTRKIQAIPTTQVPMQNNIVPREASPSPSFRERQRTIKSQPMPLVPSVNQILTGGSAQHTISQPSPTGSSGSLPSRRSPPATTRISPAAAKLPPTTHMSSTARGDLSPPRVGSPPPLLHTQSAPVIAQVAIPVQPGQPAISAQPRPIMRGPPPEFLAQFQAKDDRWHVTEELLAEIERADQQQGQLQGTSGVAYAGGASSNSNLHLQLSAAKDPTVERIRATDRSSPKEVDNSLKRQSREKERDSPKTRERSQTTSSNTSQHSDQQSLGQRGTPEYRASGSPTFVTPLSTPGERTATYAQYVPESYQMQAPVASQAVPRKPVPVLSSESPTMRSTPPSAATRKTTPPSQSKSARVADRALPLQEELDDDIAHEYDGEEHDFDDRHHESPSPSDVYTDAHSTRYEDRHEHASNRSHSDSDGDMTLNEEVQEQLQAKSEGEESQGFTPRSPTTNLPERSRDGGYSPTGSAQYSSPHVPFAQPPVDSQKTIRNKGRVASTDQLGMRSLDPTLFNQPASSSKVNGNKGHGTRGSSLPEQGFSEIYSKPTNEVSPGRVEVQPAATYPPPQSPSQSSHFDDLQGLFDTPYLQHFFPMAGSRPGAPIPPTPQSHTAAPSPSPLSAMPSDIEPRQVGSPYPYPFTHIRRTALSAAQIAPSSTFDHNNPEFVREQLALQMQIYALNNGLAPPSDSTFSPSSTPFPGVGYNPWGMKNQWARPGDASMSMRSSPSHEPIPMPIMPPMRGRGLRRKDNAGNLRAPVARRRVKPPPRVESTQPRDTSPEPSSGSGEETAGEEQFVDHYLPPNGAWPESQATNDPEEEVADSEWVDEEEEEEEDLLQLEFHPTFINSPAKRRRRWETRWDALTQAVQALDRETDATVLVLAAPSHSSKLHALTSRSIRRDPNLFNSPAMAKIRSGFSVLAGQRRVSRTRRMTLADRLSSAGSGSSATASQGGSKEEDLRRALEAALGSLNALGTIYEQREARWRDEMRRISDDRERVSLLLTQALGPQVVASNGHTTEHPLDS